MLFIRLLLQLKNCYLELIRANNAVNYEFHLPEWSQVRWENNENIDISILPFLLSLQPSLLIKFSSFQPYLSIYLPIYLHIYLSYSHTFSPPFLICLTLSLSVSLSIYLCLSLCFSLFPSPPSHCLSLCFAFSLSSI